MPQSAPRICTAPGCNTLVLKGRCDKHKIVRPSTTRHKALYNTARWKRLRQRQLMTEPLCRHCSQQGITTAANEVDHIQPHNGDQRMMYEPANLQSLCKPCHSRKTLAETAAKN